MIKYLNLSYVEKIAKMYSQLGVQKFNLYFDSNKMMNLTSFYEIDLK